MSRKSLIFMILSLLTLSILSQEIDIKNIPTEIKKPIKVCGIENDEVILHRPVFVKYNEYDKNLYVVDENDDRIIVLDTDLNLVISIGRQGKGPVEFDTPFSINFDYDGNKYINDYLNKRIQILDKQNNYIAGFNVIIPGLYSNIGIDRQKRIYVNIVSDNKIITLFNSKGVTLTKFGKIAEIDEPAVKRFYRDDINRVNKRLNQGKLFIDDESSIYFAYDLYPILRKYNGDFNLLYEIKYDFIPEVKESRDKWRKKLEGGSGFFITLLNLCITVDKNYMYMLSFIDEQQFIYVFDKYTGGLVKKIKFKIDEFEEFQITSIDAVNKDFIFAADTYKNAVVLKFEK